MLQSALITSFVYVFSLVLGGSSVAVLARRLPTISGTKSFGPVEISGVLVFALMLFAGLMLLKSAESLVSPGAQAGALLVASSLGLYALIVEIAYRRWRKSVIG